MDLERIDPSAVRWLIGGELARLRNEAGLSLAEAAGDAGLTVNKLNHMENARSNQAPEDIAKIGRACDAPEATIKRLVSAASMPTGKPWWNRWRTIVPDWFGLYLGLEGMATSLFVYEIAAIHGLLQTREYAEDVTRQSSMVSADTVGRRVSLRMSRAERLEESPSLKFHAVLDESVFRRKLTDPTVLRDQYAHLLAMTELENVTLQVIPTARGVHGEMSMGNYALLAFDDLSGVAYSELYNDALYIREPDKIQSYQAAAAHLCDIALSPDETHQFINDLRRSES